MMMNANLTRLIFFAAVLVVLTGCDEDATMPARPLIHDTVPDLSAAKTVDPSRVLATVDGKPINVADIEEYLKNGLKASSAEDALQKVIETYLLADEAGRRGYGEKRDVSVEYKKALARAQLVRTGENFTISKIPTNVLEQEYERQKDRFVHGVIRNVVHSLVVVPEGKEPTDADWRIAQEIQGAVASAQTADDFRKAVAAVQEQHAQAPIKVEDIFPFDAQSKRLVKPFVTGAFAVNYPSERISKIVQTQFGLHIIFIITEKEAENRSFEEVKTSLAKAILPDQRRQHVADYLDKLVAEGHVFVYDEILAEMGSVKGN
ncbi:MAG: peptidyl-prolyl cis-trans isomerase [Deltaproteobacteria bacterium]|nr:peptidyl-prolyl cis-trans isomerase [Deltaproteobacteria bacterium]